MEQKTWLIYKHTCKVNGKGYIGMTCQDTYRRWQNGFGYNAEDQIFGRAVRKYGWENFSHEILEDNLTFDQANLREQYWISFFHTYIKDPKCNGYNMTLGGAGTAGHECSEEAKQKISKAHLGKQLSDSHRQHIKEATTGASNPFYGKHHSTETKEKIRQKALGRKVSTETKQKISESLLGRETSEQTRKLLSEKLTGLKRSDEAKERIRQARFQVEANRTLEERIALNKKLSEASTRKRRVRCIETGDEFDSMTLAAEFFGIKVCSLANHLAGRTKSIKKLHFEFVE